MLGLRPNSAFNTLFLCGIYSRLLSLSCADGPEWVQQKDTHQLSDLVSSSKQKLCRTNMDQINTYLDNILVTRVVGTENHRNVMDYIRTTLANLGYTVKLNEFFGNTPLGNKHFRNIIATADPLAKRRLVLSCHYDSKLFYGFNFLGATDSAFPCAMLLDVATTLKPFLASKDNPDLTLELIFFDGEEAFQEWTDTDSLYGSRQLASEWANEVFPTGNLHGTKRLDSIDALVLLDLLGSADTNLYNYPQNVRSLYLNFPKIESELNQLNCLLPVTHPLFNVATLNVGQEGIQDDHIPFLRKGVRIVHLISYPFPTVWHNEGDNRSALDSNTMSNLAAILRVFTAEYLRLTIPPTDANDEL